MFCLGKEKEQDPMRVRKSSYCYLLVENEPLSVSVCLFVSLSVKYSFIVFIKCALKVQFLSYFFTGYYYS